MIKLLKYLKGYRKETILGPTFKLCEVVLELLVPLVIAAIINNGITPGDKTYIIKMSLVLVLLAAGGLAFSLTAQFFCAKAAVGFTSKLKSVLFRHIQKLSYAELDKIGSTTLITRMTNDMNQVQSGVNLTLRLLLRSPFVVVGSMIMAFTVDKKAAMPFAWSVPILAAVIFLITFGSVPLYRKVQAKLDLVMLKLRESLIGVRVLRAFCKEGELTHDFKEINQELTGMQKFAGRITATMDPIAYIIINAAIIVLVYTGALRVEGGILTQGAVVALYNYMAQIVVELVKFANLVVNVTKSIAGARRISEVLDIQPSIENGSDTQVDNTQEPLVEFRHASLRYQSASGNALDDISFTAEKGQMIGIIGGTGSGKTSLISLIPRFYDTYSGDIFIKGKDIRDYDVVALREKMGIVPQKAVLFHGTIRENIKWGNGSATDSEIMEAVKVAQGEDVVALKPEGLDYEIEQGGKNLSGGQRQRLTIARALVKKPEILILDDSSSALDMITDGKLRDALRELDYKPLVFIVSQRTSSIKDADKIIVLDDGKMVGIGTHAELLENCDVYREIYDSQFYGEEGSHE